MMKRKSYKIELKTRVAIVSLLAFVLLFSPLFLSAQSPELMSYQAVVRDAGSNLVKNSQVGMRISILQGAANGSSVYEEEYTVTTNANGLVSLEIGSASQGATSASLKNSQVTSNTSVSGGFSAIDWADGSYFIKVETDPTGGTNYTITGVSQLLSVPYALHAKSASNVKFTDGDDVADAAYTKGNVGIGTASPIGKLDVLTAGWTNSFVISHPTLGHTNIIQASDGLLFKNSNATDNSVAYGFRSSSDTHLIDIVSNGNVGIGTSNPEALLHVYNGTLSNSYGKHTLYLTENNDKESLDGSFVTAPFYGIGFRRLWKGTNATNIAGVYAYGSAGYKGGLALRTNNNGVAGSDPNVNAVIIRPDGNVGIGAVDPKEKLVVNGKAKIGEYTLPSTDGNDNDVLVTDGAGAVAWQAQGAGSVAGGVSLGGSMLTAYMVSQNMFTPHENNCGDDAWVPLFSGATVGFCIERDERTASLWIDAMRTCLQAGKRLPEPAEWQLSCYHAGTLGLSNMTNNYEWASNFPQLIGSAIYKQETNLIYQYAEESIPIFGNGGCNKAIVGYIGSVDWPPVNNTYRCVH